MSARKRFGFGIFNSNPLEVNPEVKGFDDIGQGGVFGGVGTETADTLLTSIIKRVRLKIGHMSTSEGYLLDWGAVDLEDRALHDYENYNAYAAIYWDEEDNKDLDLGISSNFLNEATLVIRLLVPLSSEDMSPNYAIRHQLYKGVADLKKMFGNSPCLEMYKIESIIYNSCIPNMDGKEFGDRFSPYSFEFSVTIQYVQDKSNVYGLA